LEVPVYEKPRLALGQGKAGGKNGKNGKLGRRKLVFAHAANGASPIFGQVFKRHVVVFSGIIFVTANAANILLHGMSPEYIIVA